MSGVTENTPTTVQSRLSHDVWLIPELTAQNIGEYVFHFHPQWEPCRCDKPTNLRLPS